MGAPPSSASDGSRSRLLSFTGTGDAVSSRAEWSKWNHGSAVNVLADAATQRLDCEDDPRETADTHQRQMLAVVGGT
jgi:hypothetical protein